MIAATTLGRALASQRAPAPHVQPGLLGIEPAPAVPELRYSLVGQMRRMAEVRIAPGGEHAHLVVEILQPAHGDRARVPLVAVYHAHADDVPALQALARQLGAGSVALVICRGIDYDAQRNELRAWRCDRITAVAPAQAACFLPDHAFDGAACHTPGGTA